MASPVLEAFGNGEEETERPKRDRESKERQREQHETERTKRDRENNERQRDQTETKRTNRDRIAYFSSREVSDVGISRLITKRDREK